VVFQNVCGNTQAHWRAINKVRMTETDWMGQRSTALGNGQGREDHTGPSYWEHESLGQGLQGDTFDLRRVLRLFCFLVKL
jgi:hypothetical protein